MKNEDDDDFIKSEECALVKDEVKKEVAKVSLD